MNQKETYLFNKGITVGWHQEGNWFRVKVTNNGKVNLGAKKHNLKSLKQAIEDTIGYLE